MAKISVSTISNAFSTGGGGVHFEEQIQAMFLLSLLIDGFCPAMGEQTKRVCFQAKHLGYDIDDLVVFTDRNRGNSEGKLLCQVKHSITATENDKTFKQFVCAAWNDLNKDNFDENRDRIALVTAQISNKAQQSLRFLHAQAIGSVDEKDFFDRVNTQLYSNVDNRKTLTAIKHCIEESKGSEANQQEIWRFCKAFILLLFDMDCEESVNRALSTSLVKCNSSFGATLVWSRLVEYAGECNQKAASIERGNIDSKIQELFIDRKVKHFPPDPIKGIDLFIPTIALIGSWNAENEHDCQIIELISEVTYSEFEAKAREMLSQNAEYLQLLNGNIWNVLHKEELLVQCKDMLFDDCLRRLYEAVKIVLSQKSKRVTSQTPYFVSSSGEYDNSFELRSSLVNSICWVKKMLPELSTCNQDKVETAAAQLVRALLENAEWTTWVSLRDCLQNLAELSPEVFLDSIEKSVVKKPQEILRLFPEKESNLFLESNYLSELLWALEILAWSPDYFIRSVSTLGLLEALPYEQTNWVNTPVNSIVSILLPWYPQTMASLEKRKNALRCLKNDNSDIFWKVLKKLLPNQTTSTSDNPRPQYLSINIPEEIIVTNSEVYECYGYLLELAVETVRNEQKKIVDLISQIEFMYEPTLSNYLTCIEKGVDSFTNDYSFALWLKLRERMAIVESTEETVIYKQLDRINNLINRLEPRDVRLKHRELYLGNRHLFVQGDYLAQWEILEQEKIIAVKEIFDQYGIEETERFGKSVNNLQDVAYKLGQSLTQNEISLVIDACSANLVSEAFVASCITGFVYISGADELLKTSLKSVNKELVLNLLSRIPFTMQLLKVIDEVLPETSSYWEKACVPYACREDDSDQLILLVDKLISCKRYVTAVNIVGRSKIESVFEAEYICNLLRLAGTEESFGSESLDDYAVQKVVGWVQKQKNIDLEIRSDIEFIYLPLLDHYSEVEPRALYTRLSLYPDYFCSLIELFYKKRTEDKNEAELNEGLSNRLFKILFQFKVTPGIDENGCFNETGFKSWMNYVKDWSKENDRYEVTMHTVGTGLSHALLDEEKMPAEAIIEELNRAENEELRRGYYLGVINQRGVHFIDPEGKPELGLADEYRGRANIAEEKGYSRYAGVLNEIADQYFREARHNIAIASRTDK